MGEVQCSFSCSITVSWKTSTHLSCAYKFHSVSLLSLTFGHLPRVDQMHKAECIHTFTLPSCPRIPFCGSLTALRKSNMSTRCDLRSEIMYMSLWGKHGINEKGQCFYCGCGMWGMVGFDVLKHHLECRREFTWVIYSSLWRVRLGLEGVFFSACRVIRACMLVNVM